MSDINKIIYGKYSKERIVGCEANDSSVELFIQNQDGSIISEVKPFRPWILGHRAFDSSWKRLDGQLHYKYIKKFDSIQEYRDAAKMRRKFDLNVISNMKEQAMVYNGFTYFKGMTPKEVGVLSFDIETTSIRHDSTAKVLLISSTFRKSDTTIKKLFSYDDYSNCGEMIEAWSKWVLEVNPSVIIGHNIFGFDFPYIMYCANRDGYEIKLGRDGSAIKPDSWKSKFRKDQTQFYEYVNLSIYGREIVDTFFLSLKYDIATKKYENYRLKNIIKQEGLEKPNRVFYDADKIRVNYKDPKEWKLIKEYCVDDSDDALAIYDLMIPATFYLNQMIPKAPQTIVNSASGAQLNSLMVRSYIQDGHSIPKASEVKKYQGAISFGKPGIYRNLLKVDFAALYPNIIRSYKIHDKYKDPKAYLLQICNHLTNERLLNKRLASETKNSYYTDLEQSQKICINSLYGFLGAAGLNFNYPNGAAEITRIGRELMLYSIKWATGKDYNHITEFTEEAEVTEE
jgi:DNA polymerase, archaea type